MKIECPQCGQVYDVDDDTLGHKVQCVCGVKFRAEETGEDFFEEEDPQEIYSEAVALLKEWGEIKRSPSAAQKKEILAQIAAGEIADEGDLQYWIDQHAPELLPTAADRFKKEYTETIRDLKARGILVKSPSAKEKEKILDAMENGKIYDAVSLVKWCGKNTLTVSPGTGAALIKADYRRKKELKAIHDSIPERRPDEEACTERQAAYLTGKWLRDLKITESELMEEFGKWQASYLIDRLKESDSPYLCLSEELLDPLTPEEMAEFRREIAEDIEQDKANGVEDTDFVPIRLTNKASSSILHPKQQAHAGTYTFVAKKRSDIDAIFYCVGAIMLIAVVIAMVIFILCS